MMRENQESINFGGAFSVMKVPEVADDYNYDDEDPDFELEGLEEEETESGIERQVLKEEQFDSFEDIEVN